MLAGDWAVTGTIGGVISAESSKTRIKPLENQGEG